MKKKIVSLMLIVAMLLTGVPLAGVQAAAGDLTGHWGERELRKWSDNGLLGGYPDGSMKPDRQVSRAEFAKLIQSLFQFEAGNSLSFKDVKTDSWYYSDIAAVQQAGFVSGYPNGEFKPNAPITRQEAAKLTAALFRLPQAENGSLAGFTDGGSVQPYAKGAMESLLAGAYLKGYPDQTVRPFEPVTRAEAVTMLDRLAPLVLNQAGKYDRRMTEGNALINEKNINVTNAVIGGNLFLTPGIGDGDATVETSEIKGYAYINGGGSDSIHFIRTKMSRAVVNKASGKVRVVFSNGSEAREVTIESGAVIEVSDNTSIDTLTVAETAGETSLVVKGTVKKLNVDGDGIEVNGQKLAKGTTASVVNGTILPGANDANGGTSNGGANPGNENPGGGDGGEEPEGTWELIWNDEFDGGGDHVDANGVNLDKWGYQLGTGSQYGLDDWGNGEQQYYRAENIKVEDGMLKITAKEESFGGKAYTSGRIYTQPTFTKTYGRFEAGMKLLEGSGLWPAFWMMPAGSEYGGWASSGEIDIMEARGRLPGEVGGTIHYGRNWPDNKSTGASYHFDDGEDITDFHEYAVEWEPGEIRWYVDDVLYQKLNDWDSRGAEQPTKYAYPAPFDKPFYMILNLAVGGVFDGNHLPDAEDLPGSMEVDYVRVYELDGRPYRTPVEPTIEAEAYPAQYKTAVDGSFVHDPDYNEPFTTIDEAGQTLDTRYWNFAHIDTFGGNGAVSVETVDGTRFAKAAITAGGNAPHAVQLIQNVTLVKGRWYKLSFDAMSDGSRTIRAKFGGGEERGWATYADGLEASLGSELKRFETTFQMRAETDVLARLEFNMGGGSTAPVWLGRVRLEEIAAPDPYDQDALKSPLGGNHVYNGSFDLGRMDRMTYWHFAAQSGIAAASVDSQARELNITVAGDGSPESATLEQRGIELIEGNEYKLAFAARGQAGRMIQAALSTEGGAPAADARTITLTEEMTEHEIQFTVGEIPSAGSRLMFLLGGAPGDIYLDQVRLIRLTDNHLPELPLDNQFPVKNSDFSNGSAFWQEHVQGRYDGWGSSASFSVQDEAMNIAITNEGSNAWDVMLMQTDFNLFKSQNYVVSLDISASVEREMELVVDAGSTRYLSEKLKLTPDLQSFSFELPIQTDITASLKLLLGKLEGAGALGAHEVFVDNVRVELSGARASAFPLANGAFEEGLEHWGKHVQGIYDGESSAEIIAADGALKAAIGHTGAEPWDIVLHQGPLSLLKGKTYTAFFTGRSTVPREIAFIAENAQFNRYLNQPVLLDETTQTFSYEFTMNEEDSVDVKLLLGSFEGGPAEAHDVFIDNVRLELKGAKEAAGEKAPATSQISLPSAPALSPDALDNALGQPMELTFADDSAWRAAVSAVLLDGNAIPTSAYTVAEGRITVSAEQFATARTYDIAVKAAGYEPASVQQEVLSEIMWSLIWSDEFDRTGSNLDSNGVDLEKWAYQNGNGSEYGVANWGNNEEQFYRKENIKVENGKLVIEAKKEAFGGKNYTSGRLWTSPTFSKAYGKFEARMKLPEGQGLWPAFWMMPKDSEYGGWASSGEIDIMEARGRLPQEVGGTIHYGKNYPNNKATGSHYEFPQGQSITQYHTYSVEWEPGELRWYVDGNLYQTVNEWNSWGAGQPDKYAFPAPFDQPFYMILNLALGGNYDGGRLPDDSFLPAQMEVDYVRAYELTGREYLEPVEPVLTKDDFPPGGKTPIDGSLLYDPDYSRGIRSVTTASPAMDPVYWNFLHDNEFGGSGSASVELVDGQPFAKLDLTAGGSAQHALQLIQYLTLTKGHIYKISFDAKASAARNMSVKFGGDANSNWGIYSDNFNASLKEEVQHYEYRFQMTSDTNAAARVEFNMGQNTEDVWIGNVLVEEVDQLSDPDAKKQPLEDGNHIYNGSFDLGTMDRLAYWTVDVDGAKADASVAVDPDVRKLEASIADGGNNASGIRLSQQGINLLQRDSYRLTFEAYSIEARSIAVQLKSKDGLTVYSGPHTVPIDPDSGMHELTFTMPADVTDEESQLEFLLGGHPADVTLDHIRLIRTTNHNVDYTGIELFPLKNGDFSYSLNGWETFLQGGAASFSEAEGEAKVSVANTGAEGWNVMLNQSGLPLSNGMTYVLSFDARSSVPRTIEASVENASYNRYFFSGGIQLTPVMKHYEYTFRMNADDLTTLKLMLGRFTDNPADQHDLFFDNVALEIQNAPVLRPPTLMADEEDNLAGRPAQIRFSDHAAWRAAIVSIEVDGTDLSDAQYEVQAGQLTIDAALFTTDKRYMITVKAAGFGDTSVNQLMLAADGSIVLNGGFASGADSWDYWVGEGGDSDFAVEDGSAKIDIYYHGGVHPQWNVPVGWSTQVSQGGLMLEAGKAYELSFQAWSTAERPITTELTGYNGAQKNDFILTNDAETVHKLSLRPAADVNMSLKFLLGNVVSGQLSTPVEPHTIYMDNVAIREVSAPPALAADGTDNKIGHPIELSFSDSPAWRNAIKGIKIDGARLAENLYEVQAGLIRIDGQVFTAVKTYEIVIEAEGYGDNPISQQVKTAAANIALGKAAAASTAVQPAMNAFDGISGTRWESESADPQWIAVDLGGVYALESIVLAWEGAFGKDYKLQISDKADPGESDWTDAGTVTNGNGGTDSILLNQEEARHVRMYGTFRGTMYGYSLWEFEVYGVLVGGGETTPDPGPEPDPDPVNKAQGKTAVSSSANMPASNVTDGNRDTRWEANWAANPSETYVPEWIYVDLGSEQSIDTLLLTWEPAYGKAFLIQAAGNDADPSEDSTDWDTVQSVSRELSFEAKYEETISLGTAIQARYMRLWMTERGIPLYGPSLYELEIY